MFKQKKIKLNLNCLLGIRLEILRQTIKVKHFTITVTNIELQKCCCKYVLGTN